MYAFFPYFGIFLGLGLVLYVVIKNIPATGDEELMLLYERFSIRRYVSHATIEKIDGYAAVYSEKVLRKTRVFLLKAERSVSGALHHMKEIAHRTSHAKKNSIVSSVAEEKKEDEKSAK
ncbi:MAG: hypothetical protein HZA35_03035 [Parcubacteria group bacterium]|nr:hypothetical protein [Parcubacteria group bacterium]